MAPWTLESTSASRGRTYSRPLGLNEHGFYLDSCFNGTADFTTHYLVETTVEDGARIFGEENVARTWRAVKQRYPLLGTQVRVNDMYWSASFVVSEKLLENYLPGQLIFQTVASAQEVLDMIEEILHGPPRNFNELPVRIFILKRSDKPNLHHVLLNTVHFVGDNTSTTTFARTFFDILASPPPEAIQVPDLEERLEMVPAGEDLNPTLKLSKPRQRWRRAIAHIICENRTKKSQVSDLHILPP